MVLEIFLLKFILIFFNYFVDPAINDESQIFSLINYYKSYFSINLDFYVVLLFVYFLFFYLRLQ